MKLPKHVSPTEEIAVAPYNFVPLPEAVITVDPDSLPDQDSYDEERLTGHIECVLTTESPVYVRCPLTLEQYAEKDEQDPKQAHWRDLIKNLPDFYYADLSKTPLIPGTSLRGMLRNLVEIVGYGKMEEVTNQRLVYRSVGDITHHGEEYRNRIMRFDGMGSNRAGKRCRQYTPRAQAGYMHQKANGDWFIQPAQEIGGTTFARIRIADIPPGLAPIRGCRNAGRIYIQPGSYEYQDVRGGFIRVRYAKAVRFSNKPGSGLVEATLARSGYIGSKRREAVVFAEDSGADDVPVSDELVRAYREQVSQEQEDLLGGRDGVLREGQPVFYLMEGGKLVFFGHTMMMRLPYRRAPLDFVPESLRDPMDVDLAEAIFGYTKGSGEGKSRAYASRVSVGDATLAPGQQDYWLAPLQPIVPKILGSPKPTTFQHYLVQQEPDPIQTGRDRRGRPRYQKRLADYASDTPGETVVRGHKLYWHKGNVTASELSEDPAALLDKDGKEKKHDTQHTQIRPVKAGVAFSFRIRFENLTAEELGALMWALLLPGPEGDEHRHSLGMGKPYGMGAVKLEPRLHLSSRKRRYGRLLDESGNWETGLRAASDDESDSFVRAFDRYVRDRIGAEDMPSLAAVERIEKLLTMLEWPGPQPHERFTRYLEISRVDPRAGARQRAVNEYRNRPVLPGPLDVIPGRAVAPPPRQRQAHPTQPTGRPEPVTSPPPRKPQETKPAPQPQLELSRPASAAEVEEGMYIEGSVLRVESNRLVVDVCGEEATLMLRFVSPPIRDEWDREERFPPGRQVRVWVRGRNKRGRIQLTMQGP